MELLNGITTDNSLSMSQKKDLSGHIIKSHAALLAQDMKICILSEYTGKMLLSVDSKKRVDELLHAINVLPSMLNMSDSEMSKMAGGFMDTLHSILNLQTDLGSMQEDLSQEISNKYLLSQASYKNTRIDHILTFVNAGEIIGRSWRSFWYLSHTN